uniref:Hemagglutinin glycoprotein n=1 Tax=Rinderpest morbillivirus TaxID=11241 RepID=D7PBP0_9MONO|nr:H [Rinderpest morbillivirus] [Rinderpest morbillivirus]AEX65766.1 H [Rinderpest morbillivirus] [Rinderpest morbillivirus]
MSSPRDRVNAFYKDNLQFKNTRVVLNKEQLLIERPYMLLAVLFVMFLSLVGLLAIAGIRLHRAAVNTAEINSGLTTSIDITKSIEHQVKDVLTPLFKIIGDEVGLRTPQRFTDLTKFISDKIKFLNPDKEYDFRDINWCISPPERIKINYDQYCAHTAAEELITTLVNSSLAGTAVLRTSLVNLGRSCTGSTTTKGQFSKMSLALSGIYSDRGYNISSMITITEKGMYGSTYLVGKHNRRVRRPSTAWQQDYRVFEVGIIRELGVGTPVFHMTNYLELPRQPELETCMLALGESKLAALCLADNSVALHYGGLRDDNKIKFVKLGVWPSPADSDTLATLSSVDPTLDGLYITTHRGIIAAGKAVWAVPVTRTDEQRKMGQCRLEACREKPPPFCNSTDWEPLEAGRIPAYGILTIRLGLADKPEIDIISEFGPLITHDSGMDLYTPLDGNEYWLTVPPLQNSSLGMVNTLVLEPSLKISPNILTLPIRSGGGDCYTPTYLSDLADDDVKLSSNLVILPSRNLQYVSATYDTSRVEHAIVYYIYSTERLSSYYYPVKLPIKGDPVSLQIGCFPWGLKLWCHHFCSVIDSGTGKQVTHTGAVGIEITCNSR